jgi:nicotinamidase/pyrazinamidase
MKEFVSVVASKDWHPPHTRHFENWPPHCIGETEGAEFPQGFHKQHVEQVFLKGTEGVDDGYSAFEATNADLQAYLQQRGVKHLFLAGLTTEYCVKSTALDAIRKGILTFIIKDAIAGVDQHPGDAEKALKDLELAGGIITDSQTMKLM